MHHDTLEHLRSQFFPEIPPEANSFKLAIKGILGDFWVFDSLYKGIR